MVEIAARPQMIESPRLTADQVVWESYEEVQSFLSAHGVSDDDNIFRNERGEWVRWWLVDDPDNKRVNPETNLLESRQMFVQRRVALSIAEALKPGNDWDFVLPAEPGATIYGQPFVWMHGGRKPETDPGVWYASQQSREAQRSSAIREQWKTVPAAEAANLIEKINKEKEQAERIEAIQQAALDVQTDGASGSSRRGR